MTLVVVFDSSFRLFSIFTCISESVCMAVLSLVLLASSSAMCMTVISAFRIDAESLTLA